MMTASPEVRPEEPIDLYGRMALTACARRFILRRLADATEGGMRSVRNVRFPARHGRD